MADLFVKLHESPEIMETENITLVIANLPASKINPNGHIHFRVMLLSVIIIITSVQSQYPELNGHCNYSGFKIFNRNALHPGCQQIGIKQET